MALGLGNSGPYAWRARVGMITPSSVHELNSYEFYLMAPEGVSVAMTSLQASEGWGPDADWFVRLEAATEEIAERGVGSLVQAGVPNIAHRGWPLHELIVQRIGAVTDIPSATDMGACIEGMHRLGMTRVAMLSPFDAADNEALAAYVGNTGIEIVAFDSIVNHTGTGKRPGVLSMTPLDMVYRVARALYRKNRDRADGVWITGAGMPSVSVIEPLETDIDAPVVTSMQAMAWTGMRLTGLTERIEGFGRLVREF